jgi:lysozyme
MIDFIKKHEGFSETAYKDTAGIWTVGYGFIDLDGKKVTGDTRITRAEADKVLTDKVNWFRDQVRRLLKVDVTDNQLTALVSLTYNIGVGAFSDSTLLKRINAGDGIHFDAPLAVEAMDYYLSKGVTRFTEFHRWNISGGRFTKGLANRRIEESELYLKKKAK